MRRRRNQKIQFAKTALLFHLYNHEGSEAELQEAGKNTMTFLTLLKIKPPDNLFSTV
jgi:hypothetical protein